MDEPEITSEMVEAGVKELADFNPDFFDIRTETVCRIYAAMRALEPEDDLSAEIKDAMSRMDT